MTNIAGIPLELASSDLKLLAKGRISVSLGPIPRPKGRLPEPRRRMTLECAFRFTIKTQKLATPSTPTSSPPLPHPEEPWWRRKQDLSGGTWANAHPDEHRELTAIATQAQSFVVVNERPNLEMLRDQLQKLQELIRSLKQAQDQVELWISALKAMSSLNFIAAACRLWLRSCMYLSGFCERSNILSKNSARCFVAGAPNAST